MRERLGEGGRVVQVLHVRGGEVQDVLRPEVPARTSLSEIVPVCTATMFNQVSVCLSLFHT